MTRIAVRVLGGVRLDGLAGAVQVGGLLAERLLGVLVAADRRPVPVDMLAEVLWPTSPPADPVPPLRMAISRLRRRLVEASVPDGLTATRGAYRLSVLPELIDVERFVAAVADGRGLAAVEPDRASVVYDAALALWRGDPFGALSTEPWALSAVTRLSEIRLAAEEELADVDLLRGREALIVDRLRLAVDAHPLRERRWGQLARCLYRLGRQGEALRAIEQARGTLRDELGIDLGEGLKEIQRAILDQDAKLLATQVSGRTALPSPARLVGRDDDVEAVLRLLGANRVVTVHGLGGVGKSTIAQVVASRQADAGQIVMVVPLDGTADPDAVWHSVAAAVGLPGAEDHSDLPAAIAGRLSARPTLLVLDGAEAGVDAAAEVAEALVLLAPSLRLLVTSRVPLGATDEVRYALDPFPVHVETGDSPAVELFLDRAALSPLQLDRDGRAAVVGICELAGGLPLALELAAATTDLRGLQAHTTGESAAVGADVVDRVVRWALDVIGAESRALLARSALLPDGTSLTAAGRLAGVSPSEVRRVLAPLLQSRLIGAVSSDASGVRYRSSEAVREVAGRLLSPSEASAAEAVVTGYLLELARSFATFGARPSAAGLQPIASEIVNLRHWLGRIVGQRDGLWLAVSAAPALIELGLGAEGSRWVHRHRTAVPYADPLLLAWATVAAVGTQELDSVDAEFDAAEAALEEHEAWRGWLYLRGRRALILGRSDHHAALAVIHDPRLLERLASLEDPWLVAQQDWIVGLAAAWSGKFAEARRNLDGIAERFLALDDSANAVFVLFIRSSLARLAGDMNEAVADLTHARELAVFGPAAGSQAHIATELAHLARARHDPAAVAKMVLAIDQHERAGHPRSAAVGRGVLGAWRIADGDSAGGAADLYSALPMLLRIDRHGAAATLAALAGCIPDRPADSARLAGAAAVMIAGPGSGTPAQRAGIDEVVSAGAKASPRQFDEGRQLDDLALIDISRTVLEAVQSAES